MKRHLLSVEPLETKALLSHLGMAVVARQHHIAEVMQRENARASSELAINLTTNQASYSIGQNVLMTLTVTNVTHHNVRIGVGPSTTAFTISQDGQTVWHSPSTPQYIEQRILHPGQSFTLTANWTATGSGNFVVSNEMVRGPVATFSVSASQPAVPVNQPAATPVARPESPQATPANSGVAYSLTTNAASYSLGQTVQMTLSGTNDTNHAVTVGIGPSTTVFYISQNGQVVWHSSGMAEYIERRTLAPGQSFTVTADWTANLTGSFVVSNKMAPQGPTAMFTVTS
jgi:hypothetical protein